MLFRRSHLTLALASGLALACADAPTTPTTPTTLTPVSDAAAAVRGKKPKAELTGQIDQTFGTSVVDAVVQVTHVSLSDEGTLLVTGSISGTSNGTAFEQAFTDLPATLTSGSAATAAASDAITPMAHESGGCGILFLDLGPLHLDILGLVVDLAPVVLDVSAVPGPGNLLGNLLCAIVGLFDGAGALSQILNIIDRINTILGSF
jgi:hypothetical protein